MINSKQIAPTAMSGQYALSLESIVSASILTLLVLIIKAILCNA
jgi:hypothetical protein